MTEAEWLACGDPAAMLGAVVPGQGTPGRKVRLFYVACCRAAWDRLRDGRVRKLVERAERVADGEVKADTLPAAYWKVAHAARAADLHARWEGADRGWASLAGAAAQACGLYPSPAGLPALASADPGGPAAGAAAQARLIRDIFGNPFRPVSADPRWLTSPALNLARSMYDSRDFTAMPILADALEEAGCDAADVLAHCRGGGPHVRGCWVVDLVLGRE